MRRWLRECACVGVSVAVRVPHLPLAIWATARAHWSLLPHLLPPCQASSAWARTSSSSSKTWWVASAQHCTTVN